MPLPQLAERLNVSVLVNKDPTADQRHVTYALRSNGATSCSPNREQLVFMCLGIFQGGCAIEALARVVDGNVDDELESLVDKSLAQLYFGENGAARYRLLEPIGEFAVLELDAASLGKSFRDRHLAYYTRLRLQPPAQKKANEKNAARTLGRRDGNLRAALEWVRTIIPRKRGASRATLGCIGEHAETLPRGGPRSSAL